MDGHVSKRLGIRFDLSGLELVIYHPEGRPFVTMADVEKQRQEAVRLRQEEEQLRRLAEQELRRARRSRREAERAKAQAKQARL